MNINIKMPKLKFKKIKMNTVENLEDIDYEKLKKENLKQKRTEPYEMCHYKTVKEFFTEAIEKYDDRPCILEKPNHKEPYQTFTYEQFGKDVIALGTAMVASRARITITANNSINVNPFFIVNLHLFSMYSISNILFFFNYPHKKKTRIFLSLKSINVYFY